MRETGACGLHMKGFGSPELTHFEAGAMLYELARFDGSVGLFFMI
jgi:hypothetical protein